jgi:hypothetical protein
MANEYVWQTPADCGGVNNTKPDKFIADNELSDCANYEPDFTGQGWLIKRDGITKVDTNERTATTYSIYQGKNGTYYHNGTVIYSSAGTSLDTGNAAAYDSWASFGGYDIMVNGTDAVKTSDGSSFDTLANIPSGTKYIASANNFLYAAGHDAGKLRYCDYGDITSWPVKRELVFSQNEADDIVGILPINNALGVFCSKSYYMVNGYSNTDQEVSYFSKSEGCAGTQKSIVDTPFGVFWWSRGGIAWMQTFDHVDYPMRRKLAKTLTGLNRAYDSLVHAAYDSVRGRVMFWLVNGAGTTCNLRVDFYPQSDAFYVHTGTGVAMSVAAPVVVSGVEYIYCGGYASSTYLFKQSGLTDNGTAITAYGETKREGNQLVMRNGHRVAIATDLTGTETITYGCYVDNATTLTKSISTATASGPQDTEYLLNYGNRYIKHRFGDAATATRTRIIGINHSGAIHKVA